MMKRMLKRVWRIVVLSIVIGAIPVLVTGCFRSSYVIDHLTISHHGRTALWTLELGSGEGSVFFEWASIPVSNPPTKWSSTGTEFGIWHDYGPFDAPEVI